MVADSQCSCTDHFKMATTYNSEKKLEIDQLVFYNKIKKMFVYHFDLVLNVCWLHLSKRTCFWTRIVYAV